MKKCPYCGRDIEDNATRCDHCYAGIPAKETKQDEQPKRTARKSNKESE